MKTIPYRCTIAQQTTAPVRPSQCTSVSVPSVEQFVSWQLLRMPCPEWTDQLEYRECYEWRMIFRDAYPFRRMTFSQFQNAICNMIWLWSLWFSKFLFSGGAPEPCLMIWVCSTSLIISMLTVIRDQRKCVPYSGHRARLACNMGSTYLSWNNRLIFAPPDSSFVLTSAEPEPSMVRSKSDCSCWIIL